MGPVTNLPYKVEHSDDFGRYLSAARDLNPGDVVLTESPLVFGPKGMPDPEASMPCVGCYKPVFTDVGERCARCGWPICSGSCAGLKDPLHHARECDVLSARPDCVLDNMADYYRHDALLPLRCLLLQKSEPEKWQKLMELQSHMECRLPGTEAYDEANEFIVEYLINNFIEKLSQETRNKYFTDTSKGILHKICGIMDTNALEIRLPSGSELNSLFSETSLLEHSCVPNTKHTFNVSTKNKNELYNITVKAVLPIQSGQHIKTMYSHALWGTLARRQHLKDTKYFSCKCERCSDPTELGTYLSAMRCIGDENGPCAGIHLPEDPLDDETDWACSMCPIKVGNSQVSMLISQMQDEVDNVQMMGNSVTILENLMCRLSTFLHPNHYHLYSIKHSLVQLYGRQPSYMSDETLDKKIKMCEDLINITNTLDPGNARLSLYSAVLHHELHSALVLKAKKANKEGLPKSLEDIKPLAEKANEAIKAALAALVDDKDETSGQKLYGVIEDSKRSFDRYCTEKKITFD
ncbi:SET domain-containing protein SmydA-8 [Aricia agestis]|uniref:SET domain-containing protein SmydA-8 n=1 Tax=Aricia agestis TaxID=91739 RepID=UPI001C204DDD|nr:SET domain-containing protein SmydA-8 [Aricia agestis]